MKKRVVSLLLALLLVLGLVPGAAAIETGADWDPDVEVDPGMGVTPIGMPEGEGTEDDPLRIENAEQLAWFAQTISDPEQGAQEVCAALTADIDLEDEPWEPMGRDTYGFKGTFDGQGHKIKGLNVSGAKLAGLFACVDGGTVKNLVVSGKVSGTTYTGAIVGYLKNGGTIFRCGNEAAVSGSGSYTGGIAGSAGVYDKTNTIEQCYNAGNVTGGSDSRTGGILGYDMGKAAITDCYNTGLISGANYAGGIRGYLSTLAGKITNCYSAGTVTGKTTGAIAPKDLYDGENCYVVTGGKILPDGSTDAVSKAELLTALRAGRDGIWKQELTENGGYPVLVWQKAQATAGETLLAQDAAFEREIIETFADEPITLPTAKLNWKPVTGASGYAISLWQKVRVWKTLTQQEQQALTAEPDDEVDSWALRLLQLDQNAIIAQFSDSQKQELLALQTEMDGKFQTLNDALEQKLNAQYKDGYTQEDVDNYDAANKRYNAALADYDAAYQACCKYIILQAVESGLSLGDYWSELQLAQTVKLGAQTSYDCTEVFAQLEDGVYYAAVCAVEEDGTYVLPTAEQVDRDVVGWQDPYTRMKPVTGLQWDGTLAKWTGKDNFTADQAYKLELYEVINGKYGFVKAFELPGNVTQLELKGALTARRSYAFAVIALVDTETYEKYGVDDSIRSQMSPTYTPSGASGSGEWFEISSAAQWMEIANTEDIPSDPSDPNSASMQDIVWSRNYRLTADIDFSTLSAKDQNRTKSFGSITYNFQGEFDGNGHEIRGLTLSNSDSGLFAYVGGMSRIHDVKIVNSNVYFSNTAAVLALNNYGVIEDCAVIGCNISADISGVMGGIAGRNYGIIRRCYVRGGRFDSNTTTATGHGGFVGSNETGGLIERCWTSMDVYTKSDYAGGFVGLCYGGTIRDCFALGNVSARGYSGGFVGRSVYSGNVYENCYAAGIVTCSGEEGHGFIGGNKPDSAFQYDQSEGITNCYYNEASETAASNYGATGLALSGMQTEDFRSKLGASWSQNEEDNGGLPYLTGVEIPVPLKKTPLEVTIILAKYNTQEYRYERFGEEIKVEVLSNGNTRVCDVMDAAAEQALLTYGYETTNLGRYVSTINGRELLAPNGWMFTINGVLSNLGVSTATLSDGDTLLWYEGMTQNHFRAPRVEELDAGSGDWTEISSESELRALAASQDAEALAANYRLTQDIDLQGAEFPGIGSGSAPFTGVFDGNGKTISNLTIARADEENVGLFRVIQGGTIKNLTLKDAAVTGGSLVGAVVGWAQVSLSKDSMSGNVAGLIGNVHVTGSVAGKTETGGLIGRNDGKTDPETSFSVKNAVDRCSFEGTLTGRTITGGLAGRNEGTITMCSTEGSVDAGESGTIAGGLVGENDGEIYDSHADVCVHAQSSVGGFMGSGSGIVKRCYSLGDVSGGGYVGGFAGSIRYVDTALSAGRVEADGSDGQGYAGGFAGYLSGTIVGAPAYVTVKAVYGYCGDTLSAAGRTDYTQTGESLQEAMAAMQLTTKEAVKERLKALFDVDYEIPDDAQKQREEAARKMQAQIEALPEADALTKEDGDVVDAAKAAFDALDDETRALVSESMKEKLTSCVSRMEELRKEPELPEDPAERFEKLMEAVPGKKDKVWNTDGAAIDAARACYDEIDLKQLDKTQQKQVKTLYSQLTAAEKTFEKNRKAAAKVDAQIEKLPFETPADMTLTHEKTVTAANKAYGKLSEEQKSFVNPENAAYLENEVLPRLKELQENKKLIQDAERLVKKVPAAAKIKASDEEKLTEALEKVQELQARSLPINEKLEKNLQESKAAFDEGMQKSEELRNLISQLDENHMDKDMAALYEQAQDMFDADKKLFQRFTTKDEQNILKNCQRALKKNQSAAQKVEKQIEKLDPDNVTTKTAKTVQKAWDAYWKLTDAQRTFVDSLLYEKLEQCYNNLP